VNRYWYEISKSDNLWREFTRKIRLRQKHGDVSVILARDYNIRSNLIEASKLIPTLTQPKTTTQVPYTTQQSTVSTYEKQKSVSPRWSPSNIKLPFSIDDIARKTRLDQLVTFYKTSATIPLIILLLAIGFLAAWFGIFFGVTYPEIVINNGYVAASCVATVSSANMYKCCTKTCTSCSSCASQSTCTTLASK
jgi:hypothetical protein